MKNDDNIKKKVFTKKALIYACIIYIHLIAASIVWGILDDANCGDFICFGPEIGAFFASILLLPIFAIIGGILLKISLKRNMVEDRSVLGFVLILIFLEVFFIGARITYSATLEYMRHSRIQKETSIKINDIENTIADDIRREYSNVSFDFNTNMKTATIKLTGYTYDNQPDIEQELSKWRQLKNVDSIRNYPYDIIINYYFENTNRAFLFFRLDVMRPVYAADGMSKEGLEKVMNQIKEYLSYEEGLEYKVYHSLGSENIDVDITKAVNTKELEDIEVTRWKNFVSENDINLELVPIHVYYYYPDNKFKFKSYDLRMDEWLSNE